MVFRRLFPVWWNRVADLAILLETVPANSQQSGKFLDTCILAQAERPRFNRIARKQKCWHDLAL